MELFAIDLHHHWFFGAEEHRTRDAIIGIGNLFKQAPHRTDSPRFGDLRIFHRLEQYLELCRMFPLIGTFHVGGIKTIHHQKSLYFESLFLLQQRPFNGLQQSYGFFKRRTDWEGHFHGEFVLPHLRQQFGLQLLGEHPCHPHAAQSKGKHGLRVTKAATQKCSISMSVESGKPPRGGWPV